MEDSPLIAIGIASKRWTWWTRSLLCDAMLIFFWITNAKKEPTNINHRFFFNRICIFKAYFFFSKPNWEHILVRKAINYSPCQWHFWQLRSAVQKQPEFHIDNVFQYLQKKNNLCKLGFLIIAKLCKSAKIIIVAYCHFSNFSRNLKNYKVLNMSVYKGMLSSIPNKDLNISKSEWFSTQYSW